MIPLWWFSSGLLLGLLGGLCLVYSRVQYWKRLLRAAEQSVDYWYGRATNDPLQRSVRTAFLGEPIEKWVSVEALIGATVEERE